MHRPYRAVDRDVLGNVEREGGFPHAWPGGKNHKLRIVQPAGSSSKSMSPVSRPP